MAELDLSKAIEAGAEAATGYCAGGWPAQAYDGEVQAALETALPHILEALAAQVEQGHPADRYTPSWTYEGARWLRAKAEEARA